METLKELLRSRLNGFLPNLLPAAVAALFVLTLFGCVLIGAQNDNANLADAFADAFSSEPARHPVEPWLITLRIGMIVLLLLFVMIAARLDAERRSNKTSQGVIRALREAQEQQEAILRATADGIVTLDHTGHVLSCNPAAERMFGIRTADAMGRHAGQFIPARLHPESPQQLSELRHRLAERGIGTHLDLMLLRCDGSEFPATVSINVTEVSGQARYVVVCGDVTSRLATSQYADQSATTDFLTGLPSRVLLHDRLQVMIARAQASGRKVGVLMIDLDHFKRVNDSLGHDVGDKLLIAVAQRVKASCRSTDVVLRMGGDEFVLLLGDVPDSRTVSAVGQKVLAVVSESLDVAGRELNVTASIGASLYPADGDDLPTLLRNADTAMYRAKQGGRGRYIEFTRDMAEEVNARMQLESSLRQALARDQLHLHYQPQFDLNTGSITGVEALLRWTDPSGRPVSPAEFIPVAEETGLIGRIGEWVLRTAMREVREFEHRTGVSLRLAVNLSPKQFAQPDLLQGIIETLEATGLPPERLELEITEGVLLSQTDQTIQRLQEIRRQRISIAVDDFGTGYSSLSYISRLPIDTLKIDQAFVNHLTTRPGDAAVAQAIIAIAESLNLKLIAEGIEKVEQLEFLRQRRCPNGQGYLLARPAPLSALNVDQLQRAFLSLPAETQSASRLPAVLAA